MKRFLLCVFVLASFFSQAQDTLKHKFEFNIGASYQSSTKKVLTGTTSALYNKYFPHFELEATTKYQYSQVDGNRNLSELTSRYEIEKKFNKHELFHFNQFEHSYARKFDRRVQTALGYGFRPIRSTRSALVVSYAIIQEYTHYMNDSIAMPLRHSFKVKGEYRKDKFFVRGDVMFQPLFNSISTYNIVHSARIGFEVTKKFTMNIDNSYIHEANIKTIHVVTVGASVRLRK